MRRGDFITTYMYTFSQRADDVGMRVGVGVGGSVVGLVAITLFIVLAAYYIAKWYKGKKKGVASKKNNGSGKKDDDGRTKNRSTIDLSEMEKDDAFSKQY